MAIYKGDKEVARMYLGTKEMTSIYKGSKLVWTAKKPWVEYVDGVLTFHYDSLQKACANTNYDLNTGTIAPSWIAENAANVTKVVFEEAFSKARPTSCYYWFRGMKSLSDIEGLDYLNTSKVTRMDSMFERCELITSLDLKTFDVRNVRNIGSMFGYTYSLQSLDVSNWQFENTVNVSYAFVATALETLDVSSWNVEWSDFMQYVFHGSKIKNLKMYAASKFIYAPLLFGSAPIETIGAEILGRLDFTNCGSWWQIFASNKGTKHIDMSCITTAYPTNLSGVCYNMSVLEDVVLPTIKTQGRLNRMGQLLYMCPKLTSVTLDFREGSTSNLTSMNQMLYQDYALPEIDLSEIDTSKVTNMSQMFYQCKALAHIYVSDLWDVSKVTDSTDMFKDCESLPNYDATKIDVSMAKYDTDGGYLTFRRYFMINKERFYIYDRNLVYNGDLGFSDSDEYVCSFNFTLGANNTAVYQRYKAAGDPESIILPFSINTDDYSDVTFYDMDGDELVGETIDGGTEFGIEVSTGHTIVFQSAKGATIVKSSLVYPETISTMDLEDDEISDNVEAYEIPDIEKPEGWVD